MWSLTWSFEILQAWGMEASLAGMVVFPEQLLRPWFCLLEDLY